MRIKKIAIDGLFNLFNYTITMNLKDRITIIHAPNGYGKTTLLKMVNALFQGHVNEFKNAQFKTFDVDFVDGKSLCIENNPLIFKFKDATGATKEFRPELSVEAIKSFLAYSKFGTIEKEIPTLRRIGPNKWQEYPTGKELDLEAVIDNYGELLPEEVTEASKYPDWLRELVSSLPVRFISSNRLILIEGRKRESEISGNPNLLLPTVLQYSNEINKAIEAKLAEYAILSQELDRSLPERLLAPVKKEDILSKATIEKKLKQIELRRGRLEAIGLLTKRPPSPPVHEGDLAEHDRRILSIYIHDTTQKLDIFNELQEKINFLKEMINRRFLYKTLLITRDKGFVFTRADGAAISPDKLSSGEQHELVLQYELLFKSKPGSLILIDEPELSLHIMWQEEFLSDLMEISNLTDVDIIIATHSPQIIHDRWDLAVELKGAGEAGNPAKSD